MLEGSGPDGRSARLRPEKRQETEHSSPPGRNSHENRQVIRCGHRPRRPSVSDAPGGGCAPLRGCRLHRDFSKCLEQRLAIRGGLSPAARGSQASGIQHVPRQNHPRGASARQCRGHYRRAARRTRLRLRYTRRRHDLQYVRLCTGNHPQSIPNLDLEVIPGITSFATLTAKAGTVLVENGEQLRIIPSFRAEMAEALDFPKGSTTILLKSYRSRGALLDRLAREEKVQVLYGEHLAMKEQALLTDPDAIRARPEKYLSLIMVKKQ